MMDPRPSGGRPVFATRSPPGYHSAGSPQSQPHQYHADVAAPPHGRNSHLQDASPSYPTRADQQKNGSRHIKGLNVIQIASTNPLSRCHHLDSQMVLAEITFWTNVCNMWLLDNKEQQQVDYAEQGGGGGGGGGGSITMDSSHHSQEVPYASGQEYGYYSKPNQPPPSRNHHLHQPTTTTHNTIHSNGVEAIHAALHRHNAYDESIMPISIAAAAAPPQPFQHPYHPHSSTSGMLIQSTTTTATSSSSSSSSSKTTTTRGQGTTAVADYKNNPYATMPRRGGRRDWRGQVPRPAGLQTKAEREFNGVDVYGRYRPE